MISDRETNTIYFSERLRSEFPDTCFQIIKILGSLGCEPKFLPGTKDIWARDYMPIQISDTKFIEYRYDPDYLQGTRKGKRNLKTYPDIICASIKRDTIKSDIILDGGNVVKSTNFVIMTEKVVKENRLLYTRTELIRQLKDIFETNNVVLIPWDILSEYGHSDGMLRFISEDKVLIHEIYETDTTMLYRLRQCGLSYEFLKFDVAIRDKRNWAYINFLQTKDLILLPKFNIDEDVQAFEQIRKHYPDYAKNDRIVQVDMTEVVKNDGALNCISWTIKD